MKHPFLCALIFTALFAGACQRAANVDREAAIEVVRRNSQFMQEEKIDEMMATLHPQSPTFAQTRAIMEGLAKKFDLKCELTGLEVVSATPDEVRVRFDQTTSKVKGEGGFPSSRVVGIHLLKKDGNAWKIYSTEVISTQVLGARDETPEPSEPEEPEEPTEPEEKK
ncbi:MAG TPA: hypothetical protein VFD27_06425 [Chthoniobacteraceae bacterium]|jgi:hypothetical protein|nr:hypothetical protein [Chthoniobacteraceae bacterium]